MQTPLLDHLKLHPPPSAWVCVCGKGVSALSGCRAVVAVESYVSRAIAHKATHVSGATALGGRRGFSHGHTAAPPACPCGWPCECGPVKKHCTTCRKKSGESPHTHRTVTQRRKSETVRLPTVRLTKNGAHSAHAYSAHPHDRPWPCNHEVPLIGLTGQDCARADQAE